MTDNVNFHKYNVEYKKPVIEEAVSMYNLICTYFGITNNNFFPYTHILSSKTNYWPRIEKSEKRKAEVV